jgi:hypothetical protein
VDDLVLRGKNEALRAFQPLRSTEFDDPATRSYLDGFAKLEANDPGALAAFAAHVGKDAAIKLFFKELLVIHIITLRSERRELSTYKKGRPNRPCENVKTFDHQRPHYRRVRQRSPCDIRPV